MVAGIEAPGGAGSELAQQQVIVALPPPLGAVVAPVLGERAVLDADLELAGIAAPYHGNREVAGDSIDVTGGRLIAKIQHVQRVVIVVVKVEASRRRPSRGDRIDTDDVEVDTPLLELGIQLAIRFLCRGGTSGQTEVEHAPAQLVLAAEAESRDLLLFH